MSQSSHKRFSPLGEVFECTSTHLNDEVAQLQLGDFVCALAQRRKSVLDIISLTDQEPVRL